jgi:hypothetical protein
MWNCVCAIFSRGVHVEVESIIKILKGGLIDCKRGMGRVDEFGKILTSGEGKLGDIYLYPTVS